MKLTLPFFTNKKKRKQLFTGLLDSDSGRSFNSKKRTDLNKNLSAALDFNKNTQTFTVCRYLQYPNK